MGEVPFKLVEDDAKTLLHGNGAAIVLDKDDRIGSTLGARDGNDGNVSYHKTISPRRPAAENQQRRDLEPGSFSRRGCLTMSAVSRQYRTKALASLRKNQNEQEITESRKVKDKVRRKAVIELVVLGGIGLGQVDEPLKAFNVRLDVLVLQCLHDIGRGNGGLRVLDLQTNQRKSSESTDLRGGSSESPRKRENDIKYSGYDISTFQREERVEHLVRSNRSLGSLLCHLVVRSLSHSTRTSRISKKEHKIDNIFKEKLKIYIFQEQGRGARLVLHTEEAGVEGEPLAKEEEPLNSHAAQCVTKIIPFMVLFISGKYSAGNKGTAQQLGTSGREEPTLPIFPTEQRRLPHLDVSMKLQSEASQAIPARYKFAI